MKAERSNSKDSLIKKYGIVEESLPNLTFRVKLEDGNDIIAHISGKMRRHFIRVLPGDKVEVEISPYNLKLGRIIYRKK